MILRSCRSAAKRLVLLGTLAGFLAGWLIGGIAVQPAAAADASTVSDVESTDSRPSADASENAQGRSSEGGRGLEPTFQPREPEPEPWYNADYIFGMTRGVANSTIAPAGKAPLFVLTVPLDIVILPFALIGGFFG